MWKTFLTRGWIFSMLVSARAAIAETKTEQIPNPIAAKNFPCLIQVLSQAAIQVVVPVAIVAIIWAGLKFIIAGSQGNEGEIKRARDMLFWVIIGTAVVVGSFVLARMGVTLLEPKVPPGELAC